MNRPPTSLFAKQKMPTLICPIGQIRVGILTIESSRPGNGELLSFLPGHQPADGGSLVQRVGGGHPANGKAKMIGKNL